MAWHEPVYLLGNVGTPLVWAFCGHLVVLNAIIGCAEAYLLSRWGRVRYGPAAWWMVAANYLSGWLGLVVLPPIIGWLERNAGTGPLLYRVEWVLIACVIAAFTMTVAIEMPFVLAALRKSPRRAWARAAAGVWVQAASYAALVLMYLLISPMTVLTHCERVRDLGEFNAPSSAWVYFLAKDGLELRRARLDGSRNEAVATILRSPEDTWWNAGLWPRSNEDGSVEIMLSDRGASSVLARVNLATGGEPVDSAPDAGRRPRETDRPAVWWPLDLPDRAERSDFWMGHIFAEVGLHYNTWYQRGDEYFRRTHRFLVNFANPLMQWRAGYPTMLPGSLVVFEMGGQVMLMDGNRRVGVIAEGRCPVVVLEGDTSPAQ